jgi:hypothetical protein
MKILVTLSEPELEEAALGGVRRRISGMAKQRKSTHPETPDHEQRWWESHVVGAIGEFAVAKALGELWRPTVGVIDQKDVGDFEVRTTQLPKPVLRYRAHNDARSNYILCSYRGNQVLIQGWLPGHTVKALGYEEFDGCWIAGLDQLFSMADLNAEIHWSDTVKPYGVSRCSQ